MGYIKGDKNRAWRLLLLLIPLYNILAYARLFGEVEDEARRYESDRMPSLPLLAFGAVVIDALWRLPDTWWFLSLLAFVPSAVIQSHFTRMQLDKWPTSVVPYRYRWGDWLVIGLGGIWTALVCIGALIPSVPGETVSAAGLLLAAVSSIAVLSVFWRLDSQDPRQPRLPG
jgi:hypothetical protein